MIETTVTIINKLGLHARASSKLVELAKKFNCNITLKKGNKSANAKSIMTVMMLAANMGSLITITAEGRDEEAAIIALSTLINHKFDEED